MWQELAGKWGYKAGSSGTPTIPTGAIIIDIQAHSTAGGTVTIGGGEAIPVIANGPGIALRFNHTLVTSANAIVFTSTDTYVVTYYEPGK